MTTEHVALSFEFFPPADDEAGARLTTAAGRLAELGPEFVSVTYGAGGSTRDRTAATVRALREAGLDVAGHLSCVASTPEIVHGVVDDYRSAGVNRIVAIRGDEPEGNRSPPAYSDATSLVAALRERDDAAELDISVAAYPEIHPRASSGSADLDVLKAKFDAGADRAITQFFFDADMFLRFRDAAVAAGIDGPIVPGIMPVFNVARITRFAAQCGATIPDRVLTMFDGLDERPEVRRMVAASIAAEQCRRLIDNGVDRLHFYTLNQANLTTAICRSLGLGPAC